MRSLVMIFFAVTTFLIGSIAVDAEIARTTSNFYVSIIWVVMIIGMVTFPVAAAIFARRGSTV
jgi:hypothetical protein